MCYSLCSVHYSLAQPLFDFNCPGSIAVPGSGPDRLERGSIVAQ